MELHFTPVHYSCTEVCYISVDYDRIVEHLIANVECSGFNQFQSVDCAFCFKWERFAYWRGCFTSNIATCDGVQNRYEIDLV